MANPNRRAGTIYVRIDGELVDAKGAFTYNLGAPKREAIVGADAIHGYKETPQVASIEGEITDRGTLDLAKMLHLDGVTVTIELAAGKTVVLRDAWYAGDGNVSTEEANIQVRFEGLSAEEIR
ncbi:phage tail tube protein [Oceanibacterium hippocampi]|uniref:Phage tail tube protein n=1 Tax=Oceanibacterium hippocampi TaxID=745714 RepID=A0A1Y5U5G4_9PROT|nr:phage tail tube protein [Oceanibacterium hippocampi]SLN77598.1 Phage tail tube protein [Oceanibacterium hippocampi]